MILIKIEDVPVLSALVQWISKWLIIDCGILITSSTAELAHPFGERRVRHDDDGTSSFQEVEVQDHVTRDST